MTKSLHQPKISFLRLASLVRGSKWLLLACQPIDETIIDLKNPCLGGNTIEDIVGSTEGINQVEDQSRYALRFIVGAMFDEDQVMELLRSRLIECKYEIVDPPHYVLETMKEQYPGCKVPEGVN